MFHSKNFLPGLASPGSSAIQTLPNYRCLLAHCIVPKRVSLMSTLTGTSCSAPNKQTLKGTSFHFVLTAGTSTVSMPVTKQLFGKDHWMLSLKFQVWLEKGGSRTKVMLLPLQLTGWTACQLQMQYWNWCLAHVRMFVKPHSVSALLMDSAVQKCTDWPHAAICNLMKSQRQL